MKIKDIEFKNNLILAPLAGVTDVAFRSLCVSFGADAGVTEMVSSKALEYKNKKTYDLLYTAPNEKIKIVQIFGSSPRVMADAVKNEHLAPFDIIDINMGCPAPKVAKNMGGVSLMGNIKLAEEIIRACVEATTKPITVKMRLGLDEKSKNYLEFAKMCERAGASAITVHGRTKEQMYSGTCDYLAIKQIKQAVKIPVIGNGDVFDMKSYQKMLQTGVDAVMIGRGTLGNPQIFSELLGKKIKQSKYEIVESHINILQQYYPNAFIVKHMRKHILWYLKGIDNANVYKNKIVTSSNIDEMKEIIKLVLDNK